MAAPAASLRWLRWSVWLLLLAGPATSFSSWAVPADEGSSGGARTAAGSHGRESDPSRAQPDEQYPHQPHDSYGTFASEFYDMRFLSDEGVPAGHGGRVVSHPFSPPTLRGAEPGLQRRGEHHPDPNVPLPDPNIPDPFRRTSVQQLFNTLKTSEAEQWRSQMTAERMSHLRNSSVEFPRSSAGELESEQQVY